MGNNVPGTLDDFKNGKLAGSGGRVGNCEHCDALVYLDHPHICPGPRAASAPFRDGERVVLRSEHPAWERASLPNGSRGVVTGEQVGTINPAGDLVAVQFDGGPRVYVRAVDLEREATAADEAAARILELEAKLHAKGLDLIDTQRLADDAGRRARDAEAECDRLRQQASAWNKVWDALKAGNSDFCVGGGTGVECAVREVQRLQATKGGRDAAWVLQVSDLASENNKLRDLCDELRADRDRWRHDHDALKATAASVSIVRRQNNDLWRECQGLRQERTLLTKECQEAHEFSQRVLEERDAARREHLELAAQSASRVGELSRKCDEAAERLSKEENSHAHTRRELDGWVKAYKELSGQYRKELVNARRYQYLRRPGADISVVFGNVWPTADRKQHARLDSKLVDQRFDERVDAAMDGGALTGGGAWGEAPKHVDGCCCAECRKKVM
jgi:hypothetical protein